MSLLEKQKIFTGDDLKVIEVAKSVVNQIGNALESAFMWTDLFKRDHDDSEYFKHSVDN